MAMVTSRAAGAGAGAAEKFSLGSLYHRLKLIEIPTGPNNASSLLWPCLEFENSSEITKDVKKAVNMSGQEDMALVLSTLRRMSSEQGTKGPVALLLGKTIPNQNRCVWFQGELLSFIDNFFTVLPSGEDNSELKDAMESTEPIIAAAFSANDSTAAAGQNDAPVALDAPPSNEAVAVENPPDHGNALEAKSTALNTSSSNDEEAIVPQKASVDSLSKVDEAIAPKESSIEPEQEDVQLRKTRASSSKEEEVVAPKDAVQTRKTRTSSSQEEEVIAPKGPSIEPEQEVVPLTTKMRASSSRKRPKTAKAARVSMDAALTAEETLQSEQDSPIADSSTTSSTQTRRTKHSSGSKRKPPPTLAPASVNNEDVPSTQSKKAKKNILSEFVILSFEEVRKSLKKGGYVFRDGIYCRPGMDPTKNTKAQLGEGYFEDEQSFRKHLCAYGVDGDRNKWTEDDEVLIQKWVRDTVVKSVSGQGGKLEYEQLSGGKASNFLFYTLGCRYSTLKGVQDVIVLPGVSKGQEIFGVNCFGKGQDGIWLHLARSGLPDSCYVAGVSERDMLSLELYVSSNAEIETFGKVQGHDTAASPGVSPSQSNVSSGGRSTRSLRKRSGDDNATTITTDSVGAGMRKTVKKQPNTGTDKKKRGRPAKATTASSTKQSTKARVSIAAISPVSHQSPVGRQLFGSLSPRVEAETKSLPEIEGTAEEKLTASLDALKMTNQAENNSFYRSGTHFASNLKTILKFLCASIESSGGHGGKKGEPAALYVCGVPGIGKTSGVKWCCTKAIEETTNNIDYEGPTPTVVHINAGHMSSASKPEGILLEEMARALGMKVPEKQKKSNILNNIKANQMILVVVDEIDLLVSESSQMVEGRRPGTEGVIQTLLDYAQDETMPIALIGISNSSANNKYHRLNEIGKFKDTVTFKSYSKDDLIGIVQARIGSKIVAPSALEFIAKKVEQNTGDARSALEMTVKAIERRLSAVRDGCNMPADQNAPLVTMADVMPAVKKSNTKIAETIEGLPTMGKAMLCVLTTLARARSKSTTLGKLKRFASDAMSESQQEEVLTLDDFKALVETLTDTGLLSTGGSMNGNMGVGNLQMMPISLGLQLEDVEVAIANGLGKERFYKNLREFTKNNTDRL